MYTALLLFDFPFFLRDSLTYLTFLFSSMDTDTLPCYVEMRDFAQMQFSSVVTALHHSSLAALVIS